MLKISDFSKLSQISIRMLRFYDEKDLLKPSIVKENGYRYYDFTQLTLATHIKYLRYLDFSTDQIKNILDTYQDGKGIMHYLQSQLVELQKHQESIMEKMEALTKSIQKMSQEEIIMNYQVEVKNMPKRYMMCKREIIPAYEQEGLLWEGLSKEIAKQGMQIRYPKDGVVMAVFFDPGYREKDVDVEIRVEVEGSYEDTDHIKFCEIAPVKVASITFTGGYEQITEISYAIAKWISDHGYEICGPDFSIYHVGYSQTQDPSQFVTEICYPIR